jgi:hypothetical protein
MFKYTFKFKERIKCYSSGRVKEYELIAELISKGYIPKEFPRFNGVFEDIDQKVIYSTHRLKLVPLNGYDVSVDMFNEEEV